MKKKILSSLIAGAFVFGVGVANVQPVSADALDKAKEAKEKYDKFKDAKEKYDQARDMFGKKNSDGSNRPAPPTDENGQPISPPDKNSDGSNRPAPPTDENGQPMPPPDKNSDGSNSNDKFGAMKDRYDKAKELFKK
ncbi:MAG: hypothetical protein IJG80_00995 [Selenomonadaceae bacterium]|nr:hypothetical protein [Selenomonadaceae bacterium]